MKKSALAIALVLLTAATAFAQNRVNAKVVEIIDGKTLVIELPNRSRMVVELQHIEVPEQGQQLHDTVREHLRLLVLDKVIEFKARSLQQNQTVGQILLGGVDISQQMIRDGAAWYAVLEKNSQDAATSEIYQTNETEAKTEKRGIWSIENLKPSWEIRAEREQKRQRQQQLAWEEAGRKNAGRTLVNRGGQLTNSDFQMWSGANNSAADNTETGGLELDYNQNAQMGYVATTRALYDLTAKNSGQQVDFRTAYLYRDSARGRNSIYAVGILSEAKDWKFLKSNSLTIVADGQKIILGRAFRLYRQTPTGKQEFLLYKISRSQIQKITKAKNLHISLGVYSGKLSDKLQAMLKSLLEAT